MGLFRLGRFRLHSGAESRWLIDCAALDDGDWEALALMLAGRLPYFASVEGVPRGGLRLAEALRPYARPSGGPYHLIVDDVLTTGRSLEVARARWLAEKPYTGPDRTLVRGAVAFARGPCQDWVVPLFALPEAQRAPAPARQAAAGQQAAAAERAACARLLLSAAAAAEREGALVGPDGLRALAATVEAGNHRAPAGQRVPARRDPRHTSPPREGC